MDIQSTMRTSDVPVTSGTKDNSLFAKERHEIMTAISDGIPFCIMAYGNGARFNQDIVEKAYLLKNGKALKYTAIEDKQASLISLNIKTQVIAVPKEHKFLTIKKWFFDNWNEDGNEAVSELKANRASEEDIALRVAEVEELAGTAWEELTHNELKRSDGRYYEFVKVTKS